MVNAAADSSRRSPGMGAWLALLPLVLWTAALVVAPTLILVACSFCDQDENGQVSYSFTLENYQRIFSPPVLPMLGWALVWAAVGGVAALLIFRRSAAVRWMSLSGFTIFISLKIRGLGSDGDYLLIFWKSTELAALTTGLCLLLGYPVAYFIGRLGQPWRNRLLMLVMIPFWTSFLIRTYAWITILNQNGLLNAGLRVVHLAGLIPESGAILYTPAAVVIGLVYAYVPFMILPIYGSVEKLDGSLIEAALDLGARPVRTFTNVIVPLTWPGIAAGVMLVFVPAIGMFAIADLMGGGKEHMIGNVIQDQFGQARDWPFGSALGVTLMAMFGLVFWIGGRAGQSGVSDG